ncbi:MAG: hypothetical protein Q9181_002907 [Wetmoreana brouardii]
MTADCLRSSAYRPPYGGLKRRWEDSSTDFLPPVSKWLKGISDNYQALNPFEEAMHAGRDNFPDHYTRQQMVFPSLVAAAHPEQWHDRLNQQGPGAGVIPFADDEPPFYLQRPASDGGRPQVIQAEQLSSQPGQTCQQAPLSHSLLSRLELSSNDPNTFRDIIDDLTVQNKKLKRQLKRCQRNHSISTKHEGCFEVRVQNLSPAKKQELEIILQRFASTLHSAQHRSDAISAASGRHRPPRSLDADCKPSPSPSPDAKALDSAYASNSATGMTIKTKSGPGGCENVPERKRVRPLVDCRIPYTLGQEGNHETSDDSKQRVVVERLEQLFKEPQYDRDTPPNALQLEGRNLEQANGTRKSPLPHTVGSISTLPASNSGPDSRQGYLLQEVNAREACTTQLDDLDSAQGHSSPHHMRYLPHLGAASPVAGSNSEASHGWVYLNLLINMAQLHTLYITPEFVRRAIQDISINLVLSDDGRKVRWQEGIRATAVGLDGSCDLPAVDDAAQSSFAVQPQQKPEGMLTTGSTAVQNSSTVNNRASQLSRETGTLSDGARATRLHYKPMFVHSRRHLSNSNRKDDENSIVSSNSSSDADEASVFSHESRSRPDGRNGPMVFFDHDPFFLDLSANIPAADRAGCPSYTYLTPEPLGHRERAYGESRMTEKRLPWPAPANGTSLRLTNGRSRDKSSPVLCTYIDSPAVAPSGGSSGMKHVPLDATGLGGIQLDDNIAIDIKTEQIPTLRPSSPSTLRPQRHFSTQKPPSHFRKILKAQLSPAPSFQSRIISSTTTHLAPSPLPPPSYVYPAVSSDSDSDSDSESGVDDSVGDDMEILEDLEFRAVSVSPLQQSRRSSRSSSLMSTSDDDGSGVESEGEGY